MPEFYPKNDPEMNDKGTKGGAPGGKEGKPPKAALRYLASWIWNAWHRPVSADFGLTFGAPLAPFGLILVPFWLKLGSFWCHVGPDLGYFAPSGVSFWLVLGEIHFLRQKFVKKHSCIDPGIKFLANFRMQSIFPRPGGGTIAAGNRDRSEIDEKTKLRRGCDFGAALGRQQGGQLLLWTTHLATIFDQKSSKRHPKRHARIDVEKVSIFNAKSDRKWCQNWYQNRPIFKFFWKRLKCSKLFVL